MFTKKFGLIALILCVVLTLGYFVVNTGAVSTVLLAIQGAITDGNLVEFSGTNGIGVDTGLSATNVVKCKFDATSAPTVNNDVDEGYTVGSRWLDITNLKSYVCLDNTDGAAVWIENVVEGDMNKSTYDTDEDGDIDVAAGGTEKSVWTQYAIPYLSDTTTFGEIPIGTAEYALTVNAGADGYDFTLFDLSLYYLKTEIDTQGKMETIWGITLATDTELAALKFTDLTDTPANYTGEAGKYVKVNAGETDLEFGTPPGGVDTSGTPVQYDYARFTDADTIEGRSYAEVKSDLGIDLTLYYLKTEIDTQGKVETIWGVTLSTDAERNALTYSDVGAEQTDAGLTSLAGLTYASPSFIKVTATDTYVIRTITETITDLALDSDDLSDVASIAMLDENEAITGAWTVTGSIGGVDTTEFGYLAAITAFGASIIDDADEATFKATVNLEIGTDVLAYQAIGIADDNIVEMDDADAAVDDYCKLTANGIVGRNYSEVKTDLGIDLSLYYLKTEIDTLSKVETIYTKDIIDSDELAALKFTDLDDTPANYTGSSLKFARVNVGETALEFAEEADPTVDTDAEIKAILVDEVTKTGDFTANRLPEINNASGIIEQSDIEHKANGGYDFNANGAGFTTQTATGDGTTTCDWRIGPKFRFLFGAQNETFTFTNPEFSCHLQIIMIQDATGSRTATLPAGIYWATGTIPTLSTAANARDIVNFFFDDNDDVYYGMGTDFAIP